MRRARRMDLGSAAALAAFLVALSAHASDPAVLAAPGGTGHDAAPKDGTQIASIAEGDATPGIGPAAEAPPPPPDSPAPVKAAPTGVRVGYKFEAAVGSTFVIRGQQMYQKKSDPVQMDTALASLKHLGPGDLTMGVVTWTALNEFSDQKGTQLDILPTAWYSTQLGPVDTKLGYQVFIYPYHTPSPIDLGHEFFGIASVRDLPVTPSVGIYVEPIRKNGAYGYVAVEKKLELHPKLSLTPKIIVGANQYAGVDGKGAVPFVMRETTACVMVDWRVSAPFYVSGYGLYTYTGMPTANLPVHEDTFANRSTPVAMIAFGARE